MSFLRSTGGGMNSETDSGGSGDDGNSNDVGTGGGTCSDNGGSAVPTSTTLSTRNRPTTRQGLSSAAIEQLITQHVAEAISAYEANQNNRNATQTKASGSADSALTWWNSHVKIVGINAAYTMTWKELMKMMTEVYYPRNEIQKLENELWNLTVKGNDGKEDREVHLGSPTQHSRKCDFSWNNETARYNSNGNSFIDQKAMLEFYHSVRSESFITMVHVMLNVETARRGKGHTKRHCPELENQNGDEEARQNLDIVTGMFLLKNRYISVLTNASANSSFIFTAISHLSDVASTFSVT
ncbi:putative reverse transcriptase domain-containing protein [Tanacetum coccineum]